MRHSKTTGKYKKLITKIIDMNKENKQRKITTSNSQQTHTYSLKKYIKNTFPRNRFKKMLITTGTLGHNYKNNRNIITKQFYTYT